jgi:tripeptidyl-peptidase-1
MGDGYNEQSRPHVVARQPLHSSSMQMLTSALLAAAIAAQAAFASPIRARTPYAVKETHFVPREWTKLSRANGDNSIQLQIGLKQGRFDDLVKHLNEGESR